MQYVIKYAIYAKWQNWNRLKEVRKQGQETETIHFKNETFDVILLCCVLYLLVFFLSSFYDTRFQAISHELYLVLF